ncbi:MAG: hypothetical protein IPK37_03635 [Austwickia sp.]|nr:MAG: hypothetical protein IPK37_03635 [Austwickia sp.]
MAFEKLETFERQKIAADKERELKQAMAIAEQQTSLTQSEINIKISENSGRAELQKAHQDAERVKTLAGAEAERTKRLADGESTKVKLLAEGEAHRVKLLADSEATRIRLTAEADADREARVGIGKAIAIEEQVRAYGGPQLQPCSAGWPRRSSTPRSRSCPRRTSTWAVRTRPAVPTGPGPTAVRRAGAPTRSTC